MFTEIVKNISSVGCSKPVCALQQISRKAAKNRFDAFLIRVHNQSHSCWCRVIEYACVILLCRFWFRSYKNLGNITDKLTIILVTGLLQQGR